MDWRKKNGKGEKMLLIKNEERSIRSPYPYILYTTWRGLETLIEASASKRDGGSGECASTGCVTDLNRKCPTELRTEGGSACRSACEAFGKPEYCCSGEYNSPASCKPSMYSQVFKSACPKSYSYAYDDATSTFTCTGADYTITFCPNFHSLKSSSDSPPQAIGGTAIDGSGTEVGGTVTGSSAQEAELQSSWLASLAIGESTGTQTHHSLVLQFALVLATSLILSSSHL
ncbi:PREDICTED: uncharacterized protein LOC105138752 [Populus euphratica]|uniref:Uncharacterized protein LOC105138752 n=1 Tax=Populus euphratica TaxID=75702 RepID=A0AAJ6V7G2_POPEU|nr:PREDICTED: uncharacterized protein LOC105138752 [Populus euphratica]